MPPARREPRYTVQDVIDLVQNGESEVEIEISDTDESDEDSDEDVCKEVDKENQPPMVCPADNYVDIEPKTRKHTMPRDRKSFHSINVQVVCDARNIITQVEAKWPGSVHDARIFRESNLSTRFARGEFDGHVLGDRGYPCQPCLLTPYADPVPGPQQRYNLAHMRTRARVENTFGILKARFQCLQMLRVTPERACDIIIACVVLHNIAILRGENCSPAFADEQHINPNHAMDPQDGRVVRERLCQNHFV
ncbi:putative nuclease HARBI1 [Limanda limanda]|uniref:putative nuclease HARBI1 n=1 Tax=Limanda limanda TaxID=27771 RepID=UPI0029C95B87|nr:putative nuclease HARBI1 [Limanda limanda]